MEVTSDLPDQVISLKNIEEKSIINLIIRENWNYSKEMKLICK